MPQKFTVPQFIDVEDKILGPITTRQFVIMIVACMMAFLGYKLFDFSLFIIWALFWLALAGVLGFMKVNGMPFHFFLLNMIQTVKRSPTRVWNKKLTDAQIRAYAFPKKEVVKKEEIPTKAPLSFSSLSELSLIADTGGSYEGETVLEKNTQGIQPAPGKPVEGAQKKEKVLFDKDQSQPFS